MRARTYDILNAGPRNRFTANGKIVSNSGAGIQPQNFPSRIKVSGAPEEMLEAVTTGGLSLLDALYDDDPMATAGACCRSVLTAKAGHELIVADYSAIEGRGLAWLAGEEWVLQPYRENKDMYKVAAASVLSQQYEDISTEDRSKIGKPADLGCGYGGGPNAIRNFGGGDGQTDEEIYEQIVRPWRSSHPMTVAYWYGIGDAAMGAVKNPGVIYTYRNASYKVRNGFLVCRLPSGRLLYYYSPQIDMVETPWGELREAITYMTVDSFTKKWVRTNTRGPKLVENVTQAICRDIMAEAMLRVEKLGYPLVMTIHDELVAEVPEGFGYIKDFCDIMCEVPKWATGFPIAAAGWRGKRYKK